MQETIKLDDITLTVEFDYQPAERATAFYPGCGEEYDITAVYLGSAKILGMLSEETCDRIIDALKQKQSADDNCVCWRKAA